MRTTAIPMILRLIERRIIDEILLDAHSPRAAAALAAFAWNALQCTAAGSSGSRQVTGRRLVTGASTGG
jgi:hypothetical protein